ncbi:S-layer homology domain-containing protein [Caldinitratiruptor microaerophilus]|uniref:SLH domain-containing protein n=1 Tax=Caldinitratiruptor microaerophilus TaxID=671077 RepID=A0AA35CPG9_9FIRM|nr:S-layer homology domain-containing protein [Caldinitratiruptor microaerophilus]BDG61587.1 hypothetical protein caldi_26770 [Caldinitratiruptor microaerophilus]
MRLPRLLTPVLALTVALGSMATPALAAPKGKAVGYWKHEGRFYMQQFFDLGGYDWALPGIARMAAFGLMKGVGQGQFQPNRPTTRQEAVVVAVRLMGREDEAKDAGRVTARDLAGYFTDANRIADWALPYVLEAVKQEIVPVAEDGLLRPHEPASRLWVSVLLVRALGLEDEAEQAADARLTFRDAAAIPDRYVGYVAVAVRRGLVLGYPDDTFRPNQPVTRAEMALLLTRTDDQLGDLVPARQNTIRGTLKAVDAGDGVITVEARSGELTLEVASNAAIFVDGKPAELGDLEAGLDVVIALNQDAAVLYLAARSGVTNRDEDTLEGTVTDLEPATKTRLASITVEDARGRDHTVPVAPDAEIVDADREEIDFADLREGDEVRVTVRSGVAVKIEVTERADEATGVFKGVIQNVDEATSTSPARIEVRLLDAGGDLTSRIETWPVAPDATIRDRNGDDIKFDDLAEGDTVRLEVRNGIVLAIEVLDDRDAADGDGEERADTREVRGVLVSIATAQGSGLSSVTVALIAGGRVTNDTETFLVAPGAGIRDEDGRRIRLSDLDLESTVELEVRQGVAVEIRVQ